MKTALFDWLIVMIALGMLMLGVSAAMSVIKMVISICKEARAARARRWWL